MTAASAPTMVLPLPTSPCKRRLIGQGCDMAAVCDLFQYALLSAGRLERQEFLDLLPLNPVCELELNPPGTMRAFLTFDLPVPHSSQKNSAKLSRN